MLRYKSSYSSQTTVCGTVQCAIIALRPIFAGCRIASRQPRLSMPAGCNESNKRNGITRDIEFFDSQGLTQYIQPRLPFKTTCHSMQYNVDGSLLLFSAERPSTNVFNLSLSCYCHATVQCCIFSAVFFSVNNLPRLLPSFLPAGIEPTTY